MKYTIHSLLFDEFIQKHPDVKVLIFDVDHTITRKATGVRVVVDGLFKGYVKLRTILSIPRAYIRYKKGTYQSSDVPEVFRDLKGRSKAFLDHWGLRVFKSKIIKDIYDKAFDFLRCAQEKGLPIILSSSTFDFIIAPLARHIGVERWIASEIALHDNVATGELVGQPNFRDQKIGRVEFKLNEIGFKLEDAAFFSDSINDLPLLQAVAVSIPVNADKFLREESAKLGWTIYTFDF